MNEQRYLSYTYQTPGFVSAQVPQAPAQFTINWAELIAGAIIGAIVGKMLK